MWSCRSIITTHWSQQRTGAMPRLTSEERASISKVDQWIAAGGGKAPVPDQALPGPSARPQQWPTTTQHARRAGVDPHARRTGVDPSRPRTRANALLGPDEPELFFMPEVLVARPGGRAEIGRPDPERPALRSLENGTANTAEQAEGGLLHASSMVSGFMTGVTALLSGAGSDTVKSLAHHGLFGPATLAIAPDGACKSPKRPRPSGKEQLPLGARPLLRSSNGGAHIGIYPPGALRTAKARRISALF